MKTKKDYLQILNAKKYLIREKFGIKSMRLFGSVARDEHKEDSDVDICVETETPNPFLLLDLKEYLETLLDKNVDIVRFRNKMNPFLKQQIENDGIFI